MSSREFPGGAMGKGKPARRPAAAAAGDRDRTKSELLDEVGKLRRKVARMERSAEKLKTRERSLSESERIFRKAMYESPIGITVCDRSGQAIAVNDSMASMVGARKRDILKQNFHELESWKGSGLYDAAVNALATGKPQQIETTFFTTSFGRKIYMNFYMVPYADGGILFMAEDQTARRMAEERLKRKTGRLRTALREKEVLLSEVHHRVKNNLAVVSSILQMQSRYIEDKGFREIFSECQNRIRSMALVHEQLYSSNNFASIDLRRYVQSLVEMLSESLLPDRSGIRVRNSVANIELSTEQLISVGMIINEALTNSLKHAFPGGRKGNVTVSVKRKRDDIVLSINDDGRGMDLREKKAGSFGLKLINIFSRQLDGTFEISSSGGTQVKVTFRENQK